MSDTTEYIGTWRDHDMQGWGIITQVSKDRYAGTFKAGSMHG